jgi:hypothetical protein
MTDNLAHLVLKTSVELPMFALIKESVSPVTAAVGGYSTHQPQKMGGARPALQLLML